MMYRVEKKFTLPMGHRLSKHKGACKNLHGHNYTILVGMKAHYLNNDDMVIDFGLLKEFLMPHLEKWDHALMLNTFDPHKEAWEKVHDKVVTVDLDPTAEVMASELYMILYSGIDELRRKSGNEYLNVEYVTVYETEGAKATASIG